jgi:hypothetical protein
MKTREVAPEREPRELCVQLRFREKLLHVRGNLRRSLERSWPHSREGRPIGVLFSGSRSPSSCSSFYLFNADHPRLVAFLL